MKIYNISNTPDGLHMPTYDEILLSGYTAGYESGYTDGIESCGHDYSRDYLTIEALEDGNLMVKNSDVGYSINEGTWETTTGETTISLNNGDKVRFRCSVKQAIYEGRVVNMFSGNTIQFKVYGNIESMEYGDNFIGQTEVRYEKNFSAYFTKCYGLIDASNLVLPATTLTDRCYQNLFYNCSSLVNPPVLPATELTYMCYYRMFTNCTSLTTAPELPAETLADVCYGQMFDGCSSLNYIKCLASDKEANMCTGNWVFGVASSGTFVKSPNITEWVWQRGFDGIPEGWTVVDAE